MYLTFALALLCISIILIMLCVRLNRLEKQTTPRFLYIIGTFIDKYYLIFLILILGAFLISRYLKLESFPYGFHVDELSMAIDAKMMRYWGMDRNGVHHPPYFFNYGGGMNALSIYVNSLIYMFAPTTIFTMRVMAGVWGALCLFAMFGICYEIIGNKGWALTGAVLVTVLPVFIMSERWGLEAYALLPFSTYTLYFLIKAIKTEKIGYYIISGVIMGFSLYTYAVSYVVWPVFLILTLIYLLYLKKVNIKQIFGLGIPLVIIGLPVFIYQLVNEGIIEPFTLGFSDFYPLPIPRESDMGFQYILENFAFIKQMFLGGEELTYNSFKEFGTIYMFMLPFVAIGLVMAINDLVKSFKDKQFRILPLFLFHLIGGMMFTMVLRGPNVNRCNELFLPFTVFIVVSFYELFRRRGISVVVFATMTAVSFVFFMYFYFFVQNSVYGYHPMHTSSAPFKAVRQAENYYAKSDNTKIYIQFDDYAISPDIQAYYFWGDEDDIWSEDCKQYGRVTMGFPEEFDENEDAVYILDNEARGHIIGYLISIGYNVDQQFEGYSILYK